MDNSDQIIIWKKGSSLLAKWSWYKSNLVTATTWRVGCSRRSRRILKLETWLTRGGWTQSMSVSVLLKLSGMSSPPSPPSSLDFSQFTRIQSPAVARPWESTDCRARVRQEEGELGIINILMASHLKSRYNLSSYKHRTERASRWSPGLPYRKGSEGITNTCLSPASGTPPC